jgi:hypothetical protein
MLRSPCMQQHATYRRTPAAVMFYRFLLAISIAFCGLSRSVVAQECSDIGSADFKNSVIRPKHAQGAATGWAV